MPRTIFIIWPVNEDIAFRNAYLNRTGEKIQDDPIFDEENNVYVVGSSRVKDLDIIDLQTVSRKFELTAPRIMRE